jgi:hypothetical protein
MLETATTSQHSVYVATAAITGTRYTMSVYGKAAERRYLSLHINNYSAGATFDLQTGAVVGTPVTAGGATTSIVDAGNGWYRCIVSGTSGGTATYNNQIGVGLTGTLDSNVAANESYAGNATSGIYIWGADLRTGSSAGTYQRIAAATDYDTVGFLPYLALDGTDDSFGTGSIDFSATDKMFVCAGLTKNSDAATGTVIDLNGVTGTGAFMMRAPSGASTNYVFFSGGTTGFSGATATPYVAPITNVVSGIGNISGDQEIIRINGAQVAIVTSDQGTGNYSNLPIYIGRRQGTALPLNGRIYQMVVCGKTLSASELASTEAYVNTKTGAY